MKTKNWNVRRRNSQISLWLSIILTFGLYMTCMIGAFTLGWELTNIAALIGASFPIIGLFVGHNANYCHAVRMDDRDNFYSQTNQYQPKKQPHNVYPDFEEPSQHG